jgi:hypothetical protein
MELEIRIVVCFRWIPLYLPSVSIRENRNCAAAITVQIDIQGKYVYI